MHKYVNLKCTCCNQLSLIVQILCLPIFWAGLYQCLDMIKKVAETERSQSELKLHLALLTDEELIRNLKNSQNFLFAYFYLKIRPCLWTTRQMAENRCPYNAINF